MKLKLLPSTFEFDGSPSHRQHLTTLVLDDSIALDAGSLGFACSDEQRSSIRDIVISHAHLDHIAGLPLFIDDLFSVLSEPVRVHATREVVGILEDHVFNWSVYPRFSELANDHGPVLRYETFEPGKPFALKKYSILPVEVSHKVQSCGFIISNGNSTVAMTGDTAPTDAFWRLVNQLDSLDAVMVECAFPDHLAELAEISHHLTPNGLAAELKKLARADTTIYVTNIKPAYREQTVDQIVGLGIERMEILEVGREYEW
ncbi:MAG: MBL fold metallo-hydrolase [Pyrinomonadaceae bacterium]